MRSRRQDKCTWRKKPRRKRAEETARWKLRLSTTTVVVVSRASRDFPPRAYFAPRIRNGVRSLASPAGERRRAAAVCAVEDAGERRETRAFVLISQGTCALRILAIEYESKNMTGLGVLLL